MCLLPSFPAGDPQAQMGSELSLSLSSTISGCCSRNFLGWSTNPSPSQTLQRGWEPTPETSAGHSCCQLGTIPGPARAELLLLLCPSAEGSAPPALLAPRAAAFPVPSVLPVPCPGRWVREGTGKRESTTEILQGLWAQPGGAGLLRARFPGDKCTLMSINER